MLQDKSSEITNKPAKKRHVWSFLSNMLAIKIWLIALLMVLILALGIWMSSGKRSLEFVKPYVVSMLDKKIQPYRVEAGDIITHFNLEDKYFELELKEVSFIDEHQKTVVSLPKVFVDVGVRDIFSGNIRLKELALDRPSFELTQKDDGSLGLSVSVNETPQKPHQKTKSTEVAGDAFDVRDLFMLLKATALKTLSIRRAQLDITRHGKKVHFQVPHMHVVYNDDAEFPAIGLNISVVKSDSQTISQKPVNEFGFNSLFSQKQPLVKHQKQAGKLIGAVAFNHLYQPKMATIDFTHINPSDFAAFDVKSQILPAIDGKISGKAQLLFKDGNIIDAVAVDVVADNLTVQKNPLFPTSFLIKKLSAAIQITDKLRNIQIENATLNFARGGVFSASGNIYAKEKGYATDLLAKVDDLAVDDLHLYWPAPLAPKPRAWVLKNIKGGRVPSAFVDIKWQPEYKGMRPKPADFIDSEVNVVGTTVKYLKKLPIVRGVDGKITFTGTAMKINATSGVMLKNTKLNAGSININDFFAAGVPMNIDLDVATTAKDVAAFLAKDKLNVATGLGLKTKQISGTAKGRVSLEFPVSKKTRKRKYFNYTIDADLQNVSQNGVLGRWDIAGLNGKMHLDNKKVKIESDDVQLQTVPSKIVLNYAYGKKGKMGALQTHFTADVPSEKLPLFGADIPNFIQGMVGVNASISQESSRQIVAADLNLTNTAMQLEALNWAKKSSVPATANILLRKDDAETLYHIDAISLRGAGLDLAGSIELADAPTGGDAVRAVSLSHLKYKGTDASVNYSISGNQRSFLVRGNRFDVAAWSDEGKQKTAAKKPAVSTKAKDENPLDFFKNTLVDIRVGKLVLGKARELDNVKGHIDCRFALCKNVSVSAAMAGEDKVAFNIWRSGGTRHFALQADNAQKIITILDINKNVRGGKLEWKGKFDDSKALSPLDSRLIITDFRLEKAPIMTKILSLASLTGLFDMMQGKGISFNKLSADVVYQKGVFNIKHGKAYGGALGFTAKGSLQPFKGKNISLSGTLVPAYAANAILGKIPVIGAILTGGDGGGIIGINYSIKGNPSDPKVSVNPLSALTPGFLRKMFDIGG